MDVLENLTTQLHRELREDLTILDSRRQRPELRMMTAERREPFGSRARRGAIGI